MRLAEHQSKPASAGHGNSPEQSGEINMGTYVYKVTGKVVTDNQGRKANLLKFAYKLSLVWPYEHKREMFETGCYRAIKYVETSKNWTGRVAMSDGDGSVPHNYGTITDDRFYNRYWELVEKPKVERLTRLIRNNTAFHCLDAMRTETRDGYRPSVDVREPEMVEIADAYDAMMLEYGDSRRAFRYGGAA